MATVTLKTPEGETNTFECDEAHESSGCPEISSDYIEGKKYT